MQDYIKHHGIKGQRWGVRRYQNEDGSLTNAGEKRYSKSDGNDSNGDKSGEKSKKGLLERVDSFDKKMKQVEKVLAYAVGGTLVATAATAGIVTYAQMKKNGGDFFDTTLSKLVMSAAAKNAQRGMERAARLGF